MGPLIVTLFEMLRDLKKFMVPDAPSKLAVYPWVAVETQGY